MRSRKKRSLRGRPVGLRFLVLTVLPRSDDRVDLNLLRLDLSLGFCLHGLPDASRSVTATSPLSIVVPSGGVPSARQNRT